MEEQCLNDSRRHEIWDKNGIFSYKTQVQTLTSLGKQQRDGRFSVRREWTSLMTSSSLSSFPRCCNNGTQIIIFWLALSPLSRFFCFPFKHFYRNSMTREGNLGNANPFLKNVYKISRLRQLKMITINNISSKYFSTQFVCDDYIFKHTSRKPSIRDQHRCRRNDVMAGTFGYLKFCLVALNFIADLKFGITSKVQCIYA